MLITRKIFYTFTILNYRSLVNLASVTRHFGAKNWYSLELVTSGEIRILDPFDPGHSACSKEQTSGREKGLLCVTELFSEKFSDC